MVSENRTEDKGNTEKLRADAAVLLEQARKQLADVQRALAAVGGNSALRAKLDSAATHLSAIVSELSGALASAHFSLRAADLMAIEGAVHSGEAGQAVAQAATHEGAGAAVSAELAAASASTRRETETLAHDFFDQHIFDPYLHFKSAQDEAEYRRREAETKKYIQEQLAKHTPVGDLNASGGMIGQMLDAHSHGAGASPDFMPRFNSLVEKAERQRNAVKAAGQSTDEFDQRLNASIRRFLKDEKGLPDAEINKALTGTGNPLDRVRSLFKDERHGENLERPASAQQSASAAPANAGEKSAINVDAIAAKLKAAGVKVAEATGTAPAHGVVAQKPGKDSPSVGVA